VLRGGRFGSSTFANYASAATIYGEVTTSSPSTTGFLSQLRAKLSRADDLELEVAADEIIARRKRLVPSRGLFRLFFPCVTVRVSTTEAARDVRVSARPDVVAWFMAVVCCGGIFVELTTDRIDHPREYPPAFVYGLSALFFANLVVELVRSRRSVANALGTDG